jgi:5,10-methylene-tetrahydrofolate dehydrogenase/methenyl tetrahydrofolate cyclohydrolase
MLCVQVPGLAVIIVGDRKDSQTYVRMKKRACEQVGIQSFERSFPACATEADVIRAIKVFNYHPDVHGILVQLPLPSHMNEETVLSAVSLEKDVDGFHPVNIGQLCMKVQNRFHIA